MYTCILNAYVHARVERDRTSRFTYSSILLDYQTDMMILIGASLSRPHINGTAMHAIYGICMYVCMCGTSVIRVLLHRLCTGLHAIFCAEKSALKNNCSNLAHLCNISLVVSRLRIKDLLVEKSGYGQNDNDSTVPCQWRPQANW